MELIRISDQKLKIMLTASDMIAYDFSPDTLTESNATPATASAGTITAGRAFRRLLEDIRRKISFETEDRRLTVQYFPSRGGGCEMFVSSIPFDTEERKKSTAPKPTATAAGKAGRAIAPAFRREDAYRFEKLSHLLCACQRLNRLLYITESTAYRDDNGRFYLLFTTVTTSPFALPDELAFLAEYGNAEEPKRLRVWMREHGTPICTHRAVAVLAPLA